MGAIDSIVIDKRVKGIIFDYGGTLDSRGDHWSHVILDGYRKAGFSFATDVFIEAYIYAERALAARPAVSPSDDFRALMRKKIGLEMDWLFANGHIKLSDIGKAQGIAEFCYRRARECVEESAVILSRLSRDYPLALVSNFYGNLRAVIADFGIDCYFKAIIESAEVGVCKPDSAIFQLGVDALGLSPSDVLVVGDSMSKDIIPACSIGCMTALIEGRPWPPVE